MSCWVVYTVDASGVTIVGVYTHFKTAFDLCEKIEHSGNKNVWVVNRAMDSPNPLPHRIDIDQPDHSDHCRTFPDWKRR
jgi:hypothetical protein